MGTGGGAGMSAISTTLGPLMVELRCICVCGWTGQPHELQYDFVTSLNTARCPACNSPCVVTYASAHFRPIKETEVTA